MGFNLANRFNGFSNHAKRYRIDANTKTVETVPDFQGSADPKLKLGENERLILYTLSKAWGE